MAKTKVKRDSHGLYRWWFFDLGKYSSGSCHTVSTSFSEGDEVNAYHRGGTNLGTVKNDTARESWHGHGTYIKPGGNGYQYYDSEDVWEPKERQAVQGKAYSAYDLLEQMKKQKVKKVIVL